MSDKEAVEALHENLIKDWQEQKAMVKEQVKLVDPMATSLRKSTARRFLNASMNVVMEILMYMLALASIAYVFFLNNLGPFYVMDKLGSDPTIVGAKVSADSMNNFSLAVKALFVLIAVLFFIIGRMLANIRHKNSTLSLAGKNMKIVSGQLLNRMSTIENLEQKHVMVLPKTDIDVESIQSITRNDEAHNDQLL